MKGLIPGGVMPKLFRLKKDFSTHLYLELWSNGLALVGTMRSNKKEIPISFLASKERHVDTSIFAFDNFLTLTSFVPKPNKSVILLSTKYHDSTIDIATKKSQIIMFYNNNKGGVDTFDHLVELNSCRRKTKRWTFFQLFHVHCGLCCSECVFFIYFEKF